MTGIGVVSYAHIHAERYARALLSLPDVRLEGIWDADKSRGRAAAKRHGTRFYESLDALLSSGVRGVIVCSENCLHREHVVAAAKRGVHVLCEKPIATRLEDAQEMIDACARARAVLTVALPARYHDPAGRLRELIRGGGLGRVVAIRGTNRGKMPGGWFVDRELAGGGAVMDHTVHIVDLMRWFLGTEVTQVYAEAAAGMLHETEIDDIGLLSLQLGNDVFATLDTSWSRPEEYPTWGDATMEIVGTAGVAWFDRTAEVLSVHERGSLTTRYENWGQDANLRMIEEFVMAVRGELQPLVSGHDGLQALRVTLAAYQSAETHEPVKLG